MAQKDTGVRGALGNPTLHNLKSKLLGGDRFRRRLVEKEIRPGRDFRLLDVGCGTARIVRFLPELVDYVGVDLNSSYLRNARKRFGGRCQFLCQDVMSLDALQLTKAGKFDLVMSIGVLHHLDENQVVHLMRLARSVVKESGRFLAVDPALVERRNAIARTLLSLDRGENVRSPEQYRALAERIFEVVECKLVHDMIRLPYTHFIMRCKARIDQR